MSQEGPSQMHGTKDQIVGKAKEELGWATGNKDMEAQGKMQNLSGTAEKEAARDIQYAKGIGEKAKGDVKEVEGKVLGDEKMKMEGKADQLKGEVRQDINKP